MVSDQNVCSCVIALLQKRNKDMDGLNNCLKGKVGRKKRKFKTRKQALKQSSKNKANM
jgi:hypothetical protein